jgi:hypothetical protein
MVNRMSPIKPRTPNTIILRHPVGMYEEVYGFLVFGEETKRYLSNSFFISTWSAKSDTVLMKLKF